MFHKLLGKLKKSNIDSTRSKDIVALAVLIARLKVLINYYESSIIDDPENLNGQSIILEVEKVLTKLKVFPLI